jgi:hypothetical protein
MRPKRGTLPPTNLALAQGLFPRVRGREILRSPYPAFCMDRLVGPTEDPLPRSYAWKSTLLCVSPAWISALVNGTGRRTRRSKSLVGTSPRRFGGPSSACHIWLATEPRRAIHGLPAPNDPSLTLTRTQHAAIPGNRRNKRSLIYAGYANPCNPQQPLTAHS